MQRDSEMASMSSKLYENFLSWADLDDADAKSLIG